MRAEGPAAPPLGRAFDVVGLYSQESDPFNPMSDEISRQGLATPQGEPCRDSEEERGWRQL